MFKAPKLLLTTSLALSLASCGEQAANKPGADMVFKGGNIYTANDAHPTVEMVVVDEGRIVCAAMASACEGLVGDKTEVIDLKGSSMYPGFTDAHGHLGGIGFRELNLNMEGVPSIAVMLEKLAARVADTPDGDTIIGRGWIETHWPEERFPTRYDLDAVSPNNPVLLRRADGHALVANSKAIEAMGIKSATEPPFGGDILKDEAGEPTGMFIDRAMGLMSGLSEVPSLSEKENAYKVAGEVYSAYGWTGIHSMGESLEDIGLQENLSQNGELGLRVYNSVNGTTPDAMKLIEQGAQSSANGEVVTRSIKLYMDGALGSRGAALIEPYSDAETSGLMMATQEQYRTIHEGALRSGIQINTHAIGDRGNRELLNWYEDVFNSVPKPEWAIKDPRWRDEHTQIVHPEDIPRFKNLGVIPSMQTSHAIGDLFFAPDRLGKERLYGAYAWRTLIDSGVIIAGGTDAPVERGDPRIEFFGAVARQSMDGFSTEDWHPEEAVTRDEALKMFTLWPAYASFMENDLGSIEVGKLADFTVFSENIMIIPYPDILKVKAQMTVVRGNVVYRAPDF